VVRGDARVAAVRRGGASEHVGGRTDREKRECENATERSASPIAEAARRSMRPSYTYREVRGGKLRTFRARRRHCSDRNVILIVIAIAIVIVT
jgi:hypothetical protein